MIAHQLWASHLKEAGVSRLLYNSFPTHHCLQTLTQTPSVINTNFCSERLQKIHRKKKNQFVFVGNYSLLIYCETLLPLCFLNILNGSLSWCSQSIQSWSNPFVQFSELRTKSQDCFLKSSPVNTDCFMLLKHINRFSVCVWVCVVTAMENGKKASEMTKSYF